MRSLKVFFLLISSIFLQNSNNFVQNFLNKSTEIKKKLKIKFYENKTKVFIKLKNELIIKNFNKKKICFFFFVKMMMIFL